MEVIHANIFTFECIEGTIQFMLTTEMIAASHVLQLVLRDREHNSQQSSISFGNEIKVSADTLRKLFGCLSVYFMSGKRGYLMLHNNESDQGIYEQLCVLSYLFPETHVYLTPQTLPIALRYDFDLIYEGVTSTPDIRMECELTPECIPNINRIKNAKEIMVPYATNKALIRNRTLRECLEKKLAFLELEYMYDGEYMPLYWLALEETDTHRYIKHTRYLDGVMVKRVLQSCDTNTPTCMSFNWIEYSKNEHECVESDSNTRLIAGEMWETIEEEWWTRFNENPCLNQRFWYIRCCISYLLILTRNWFVNRFRTDFVDILIAVLERFKELYPVETEHCDYDIQKLRKMGCGRDVKNIYYYDDFEHFEIEAEKQPCLVKFLEQMTMYKYPALTGIYPEDAYIDPDYDCMAFVNSL